MLKIKSNYDFSKIIMKAIKQAFSPIKEFIHDSRFVGILLLLSTALALFIANSTYYPFINNLLHHTIITSSCLPNSLTEWINDFLMVFYFLLVGLEIKRALLVGELKNKKTALTPIIAALGGMLIPGLIYFVITKQTSFSNGWGIPMATDIAFSLGILSLFSKRIPISVKIFLMALAIIDDLGGILVIALFYSKAITFYYLLLSTVLLFLLWKFAAKLNPLWSIVLSLGIWYCIHHSGIHGTIAGVAIAWCLPIASATKLEHILHDFTSFIILPVFVFANTLLPIPTSASLFQFNAMQIGIIAGLTLGKPIGILSFLGIGLRLKWCQLPSGGNWKHLIIVAIIAGIGFTISLFISKLAFANEGAQQAATIAILVAFCISLAVTFIAYQLLKLLHQE